MKHLKFTLSLLTAATTAARVWLAAVSMIWSAYASDPQVEPSPDTRTTILAQIPALQNAERALPPGQKATATLHQSHPGNPVESLTGVLDLTPEQQEKLRAIFKDQRERSSVLHANTSLPPETRLPKLKEIHETAEAAIKAMLTPEQFVKLEKMRQGGRADQTPAVAISDKNPVAPIVQKSK